MKDHELFRQLQSVTPPAMSPAAREEARRRAVAALEETNGHTEAVSLPWRPWAFAAAVVFLLLIFALARHSSRPPASSESSMLAQMEDIFPGELDAVIERNGQFKVALAARTSGDFDQPLLVEFRRDKAIIRVLSFSGRHVCLDLEGGDKKICFEALLDERGGVIVVGEDFVSTSRQPASARGWKVAAHSLPRSG